MELHNWYSESEDALRYIPLDNMFQIYNILAKPDWSRSALLALREIFGYETNLLQSRQPFF